MILDTYSIARRLMMLSPQTLQAPRRSIHFGLRIIEGIKWRLRMKVNRSEVVRTRRAKRLARCSKNKNLPRSNISNFPRLPISIGIEPFKKFPKKLIPVSDANVPISEGIVPERLSSSKMISNQREKNWKENNLSERVQLESLNCQSSLTQIIEIPTHRVNFQWPTALRWAKLLGYSATI